MKRILVTKIICPKSELHVDSQFLSYGCSIVTLIVVSYEYAYMAYTHV